MLTHLLAALRRAGSVGVINGYAYTSGSARRDYRLSLARAAAVAHFLENRGIPASSLIVVGHGASHLVDSRALGGRQPGAGCHRGTLTVELDLLTRPSCAARYRRQRRLRMCSAPDGFGEEGRLLERGSVGEVGRPGRWCLRYARSVG